MFAPWFAPKLSVVWKMWKTGIRRRLVGSERRAAFAAAPFAGLENGLEGSLSDPFLQGLAVLVVGLAVLGPLGFRSVWRRRRAAGARGEKARREMAELHAILEKASAGFFFWRAGETQETAFGDFSAFGFDGATDAGPGFEGALRRFEADSAEQLQKAVSKLRAGAGRFDLDLATDDARRLRARGQRLESADGEAIGDLVRLEDVTEVEARALQFTQFAQRNAKLLKDRERLRFLLDQLPFPVWLRGPDLKLEFCNRAYASVVGLRAEEAVARGREFAEGIIGEQGQALAKRAHRVGSPQSESHHFVVDGVRRLLEVTEIPFTAAAGMVGYAQDFTEVDRVQDELGRHIDAQAKVLEGLATAIAIYGPDTRLKFFNRAFALLWRLNEEWLRMEPTQGEVLETLRARRRLPETVDFPAYKKGQLARFTSLIDPVEELLHLPDGATLRSSVSPHPFGGLLCTYEDVTDKLALERSYNTLIKVQRQSLDNLYEGVAVFGSDGRLKLSNPAYAQIWGFAPNELEGEPHISEIVDKSARFAAPEDWPVLRARIVAGTCERAAKNGRFHRQDGTAIDFASLPLPDGGVLWRYVDVTDSTRVEHALRERNEALLAADKLMSEFVAHVSYELRTPLNTIIGFAQLLENAYFGDLNDRQQDYVAGILVSSQVLLSLINDILDLALIEAGQMPIRREEVAIRSLLEEVLRLVREKANEKNLTVVMDIQGNPPPIYADKQRLKQVLFKLLNNAINFSTPGGEVSLSARKERADLVLQVTDTGVGIPREEQTRIFEKFERGSSSKGRGSGLGLSLVKKFVELHYGQVDLQSEPGQGTAVRCRLPYAARDVAEGEAPPAGEAQPVPPMKTGT